METKTEQLTFEQALKILNIEQYEERIRNSKPHDEEKHFKQYIAIARHADEDIRKIFHSFFTTGVKKFEESPKKNANLLFNNLTLMFSDFLITGIVIGAITKEAVDKL